MPNTTLTMEMTEVSQNWQPHFAAFGRAHSKVLGHIAIMIQDKNKRLMNKIS